MALSWLDALHSSGLLWRAAGVCVLLALVGIIRTGWTPHAPPIPDSAPNDAPVSADPRHQTVWERDNPIPPPERGRDKAGILDRIKLNLRDRDRQDRDINYQLCLACAKGDRRAVEDLLHQGADPKYRNRYAGGLWETPLMAAAASGKADVVRLILDQPGVDPHVEDRDYQTAWTYASTKEVRQILEKRGVHR